MSNITRTVKFDFGDLPVSVRQAIAQHLWHLESITQCGKRVTVDVHSLAVDYTARTESPVEGEPAPHHHSGPIGC